MSAIVVLDNGGDTCKVGLHTQSEPLIIPNVAAKVKTGGQLLIGDQIDKECDRFNGLTFRRPYDKGYLCDIELETLIWKRLFGPDVLNLKDRSLCSLVLSHPPFQPRAVQEDINELAFETFGFASLSSISGPVLSLIATVEEGKQQKLQRQQNPAAYTAPMDPVLDLVRQSKSALVVETGFSFSHVVPIIKGQVRPEGIRRVNIGGKVLTNYLKEVTSVRAYDMTDETYLMNVIKERTCYVSLDFLEDLKKTRYYDSRNSIQMKYVLPDYTNSKLGYAKKFEEPTKADEQVLIMNNERISVPEILFNPSDIGMNQAGIAEAVMQSIDAIQLEEEKQLLLDSIVLIGGSSKFPNFKQRFCTEVRSTVPNEFDVNVYQPENPVTQTWKGGKCCASNLQDYGNFLTNQTVSKQDYEEHGHTICLKKFGIVHSN